MNDPGTPRPLLTLDEFFDGNHHVGSIGCNLAPMPRPEQFYDALKAIRDRPDVVDVRVEISAFDDPAWPFADTVWIITSSQPDDVARWLDEDLRQDEVFDGWTPGQPREHYTVPSGMNAIGLWWD